MVQTMTDSIPMIDSILYPRHKAKWEKLDESDDLLVRLHRKFWLDGNYDASMNASELDTDYKTVEPMEGIEDGEGPAEVIEGIAEDNDDVGPECCVLDLETPKPGFSKLWVRKEFFRMYDQCKDHFEAHHAADQSPSVIVTGQPGIGKSYWIRYVLCRRLARKKPTMWYRDNRLYLFVEEGVYEAPTDHPSTQFRTRVWTLVDADHAESFPDTLAVHDTKHMIIFATFPQKKRWKNLTKTTTHIIAVMNPWTRGEISAAASTHGFKPSHLTKILEMYTRYGPTPRICFDLLKTRGRLCEYQGNQERAISSLSSRSLQQMVRSSSDLNMDDTIFLMKRRGDLSRSSYILEPITPTIEMAIRNQFQRETRADRLALYHYLSNVAATRLLACVVYESLVQEDLQQRPTPIDLNLVPMTRRTIKSRWCSNHGTHPPFVLPINREANDVFSSKPDSIKEKVYYTPCYTNQAAFDSFTFIMDSNRLFIFQFTVADLHEINKGILTFFSQASLPPRANWYFIFVVPSMLSELKCSQSTEMKTFLEEIHLCTMIVDPQASAPVGLGGVVPTLRFNGYGEYSGLLYHSPHRVIYKDQLFPTALHLFEALKFLPHRSDLAEQIRLCEHVEGVTAISASFAENTRRDWGNVALHTMDEVLHLKFRQHSDLRTLLLGTFPADLIYVESGDAFWGDGAGTGMNELGKSLMRVREQLRSQAGM